MLSYWLQDLSTLSVPICSILFQNAGVRTSHSSDNKDMQVTSCEFSDLGRAQIPKL